MEIMRTLFSKVTWYWIVKDLKYSIDKGKVKPVSSDSHRMRGNIAHEALNT